MRTFTWTIGVIAPLAFLAGCQDNPDAGGESDETVQSQLAPQPDRIELQPQGISAGAEAFTFNAGRSEVEAAVNAALGEAGSAASNEECEAGPIDSIKYASGLTLNFQNGNFVGWFARSGSADAPGTLETATGVAAGDSIANAQAMDGYELLANSTLDGEFNTASGISGFVDDTNDIIGLYSGTNCFFR